MIGSGMEVTVLKLVSAFAAEQTSAIDADYQNLAHYFEASDFTVDCNLAGQPIPANEGFARVACAAINVPGSHTRLRRIRVINWGSQIVGVECFVLVMGHPHPLVAQISDCVIENCIADQPSGDGVETHSTVLMGGGGSFGAYLLGGVVRRCFVDGEIRNNDVPIESITTAGTAATVKTRWPHGRKIGDWATVSGAYVNSNPDNPFNGSFQITALNPLDPTDLRTFTCTLPVTAAPIQAA